MVRKRISAEVWKESVHWICPPPPFLQIPACLWASPATRPIVTIKRGGPRCHGWAQGRTGVEGAAPGHTGSRMPPVNRERTRTRTRVPPEGRGAAETDSTQVPDGCFCFFYLHTFKMWGTSLLKCFPSCPSHRIWGDFPIQSSIFPIRTDSEGAGRCKFVQFNVMWLKDQTERSRGGNNWQLGKFMKATSRMYDFYQNI